MTDTIDFCNVHNLPLEYGPNPYAWELYDDKTDVWMCAECRNESAQDI